MFCAISKTQTIGFQTFFRCCAKPVHHDGHMSRLWTWQYPEKWFPSRDGTWKPQAKSWAGDHSFEVWLPADIHTWDCECLFLPKSRYISLFGAPTGECLIFVLSLCILLPSHLLILHILILMLVVPALIASIETPLACTATPNTTAKSPPLRHQSCPAATSAIRPIPQPEHPELGLECLKAWSFEPLSGPTSIFGGMLFHSN
jgi:hypothetical protein